MAKAINWEKFHRFQEKDGWCGPATIQMILLAGGIEKTQAEIAKDVDKGWWGTTQGITVAYLSRFFDRLGFERESSLEDVKDHLDKGHAVILDWWDDLDDREMDGHYSLAVDVDLASQKITLADPSQSREGIWEMGFKEFEDRWFDYLDVDRNIKLDRWILWIDLSSRKASV